jgi:putative transposase
MDLAQARKVRILTVIDDFTTEALATEADTSLTSRHVIAVLERIAAKRGLPRTIKCDNGSEFRSLITRKWAAEQGV